ncbi:MAG: hypothetical protein LLG01_06350 [Planctomycetaceae bacterium]|nr:hypothetical protein [Planctomycetaceae bacterium]
MIDVVLILSVIVVCMALHSLFWHIVERLYPLIYTGVKLDEFAAHFGELAKRGESGSEMVISEETTGKAVRLRKEFAFGPPRIRLMVIADDARSVSPHSQGFLEHLQHKGIACAFHVVDGTFVDRLVCQCDEGPERAAQIATELFCNIYGVGVDARYSVRVRGRIWPYDALNPCGDVAVALGPPGKPYKRWQVPGGFFYLLGRLAGRIVREIRGLVFPSDGPDDLPRR